MPDVLLRYIGPHDEVELNVLPRVVGERWEAVKRGDTIAVHPDVAPGFLEQPTNWEPVAEPSAKPGKGDTKPGKVDTP